VAPALHLTSGMEPLRNAVVCAAIALATSLPACSAGDPPPGTSAAALNDAVDAGTADSTITCQYDPLVEPYAPNMTQRGSSGLLEFRLQSANPAPPALGLNSWTVAVLDANGVTQDASFVEIKPWMPYHGHGASIVPQASPNGDGTYLISNLDFFMVGVWQITLSVQTAAGNDSAVFSFCVGE
jgi:hypothetical protein